LIEVLREEVLIESPKEVLTPKRGPDRELKKVPTAERGPDREPERSPESPERS